ncbi:uncharacterized protein FIESC28_05325 [Fusarium coffeatum]|uniref:Cell wall protein n=1 Tax=Fusarium coffeatum TaxID=231269 RepID=A0A366RTE6_9HYPO|nr:uncharacterized protein FIESC28_05325 [Fusarium coffeatum]RBR20361.1 hypothetical protein FIESC28_05325 [Fusarium coffeatum]
MKSVIALAFFSAALAAPQFDEAQLSAFFDSLSSLLGNGFPSLPTDTQSMTDILTFSTAISGTPTEITTAVAATTDAFDNVDDFGFDKRQAPGDLEAIISSLNALITPATTSDGDGCVTDVVPIPTTINGVPTEVSSIAAVPTAPVAAPDAPAAPAAGPGEAGGF